MVRSSIPQKQAPIPLSNPQGTASFDPDGTPRWKPEPFPVAPPSGTILGAGFSRDSKNPIKGSSVNLDLGAGNIITGEVMDYFVINDQEHVQVKMGTNVYLRPSANIR